MIHPETLVTCSRCPKQEFYVNIVSCLFCETMPEMCDECLEKHLATAHTPEEMEAITKQVLTFE